MEFARQYIKALQQGIAKIPLDDFEKVANVLLNAYEHDKQVFIMGNGGSAAISSHMDC